MSGDAKWEVPDMPGADAVVAWFGYWPTFHDAEVLSIYLDRSGPSRVVVHCFETTSEVDQMGRYVLAKHAIVTFSMEDFAEGSMDEANPEIVEFNHQNMLGSISMKKSAEGFELLLHPTFGVSARFRTKRMWVGLKAGIPEVSMYRK